MNTPILHIRLKVAKSRNGWFRMIRAMGFSSGHVGWFRSRRVGCHSKSMDDVAKDDPDQSASVIYHAC